MTENVRNTYTYISINIFSRRCENNTYLARKRTLIPTYIDKNLSLINNE